MKKLCTLAIFAGLVCSVAAQDNKALEQKEKGLEFDLGGDLRIRQEFIDNIPNGPGAKYNNYFRIRPRIWGEAKYENFRLYTRLTDEFREYIAPSSRDAAETPDELVVDNLYFDANDLFDGWLDLRVGRQDLVYGAGRIILDGTPGDGSRTIYMDAIKASINFDAEKKNVLDILAIYNQSDNELSMGGLEGVSDRQLTLMNGGEKNMDEYGGGLYFKSKELDEMPFELYWIFKRETKADYRGTKRAGRSFHTFGLRLMPKYSATISGEFEGAAQSGEIDGGASCHGYMAYGALKYTPDVEWKMRPFFKTGLYYLSGDTDRDRNGAHGDSGWNPVWGRWPQPSELYVLEFKDGIGYWTNLIYPHVETGFNISRKHKFLATAGPMYADRRDNRGGGNGDQYGWLGTACYDFPIMTDVFGRDDKRGNVTGRLQAEVLDPGDYYDSSSVAYFLRWQIMASF